MTAHSDNATQTGSAILADSHAHLTEPQFEADLDAVIRRAREAGVQYILTIGTSAEDTRRCLDIAGRYDGVYASAGIQPHSAHEIESAQIDALAEIAGAEKIVAVGETGLEYYHYPKEGEAQKELVRRCIGIAREVGKPVIYHSRQADEDTVALLEEEKAFEAGGVIHCFSGSREMARRCLEMGLYISFAGPVTFPKSAKLRSIAEEIPLDRILVETDAPYLAPQPFRGKRNEPAHVVYTAAALAEVKGVSKGELFKAATENFRRLFGIREDQ